MMSISELDLQICNTDDDPVFSGTELPICTFMAADIEACQAKGKIASVIRILTAEYSPDLGSEHRSP